MAMLIGLWLSNEIHKDSVAVACTYLHQLCQQPMLERSWELKIGKLILLLSLSVLIPCTLWFLLAAKCLSNLRTNLFNTLDEKE